MTPRDLDRRDDLPEPLPELQLVREHYTEPDAEHARVLRELGVDLEGKSLEQIRQIGDAVTQLSVSAAEGGASALRVRGALRKELGITRPNTPSIDILAPRLRTNIRLPGRDEDVVQFLRDQADRDFDGERPGEAQH
jgi:hypothetical protein